jgi:hypothetical protein
MGIALNFHFVAPDGGCQPGFFNACDGGAQSPGFLILAPPNLNDGSGDKHNGTPETDPFHAAVQFNGAMELTGIERPEYHRSAGSMTEGSSILMLTGHPVYLRACNGRLR